MRIKNIQKHLPPISLDFFPQSNRLFEGLQNFLVVQSKYSRTITALVDLTLWQLYTCVHSVRVLTLLPLGHAENGSEKRERAREAET